MKTRSGSYGSSAVRLYAGAVLIAVVISGVSYRLLVSTAKSRGAEIKEQVDLVQHQIDLEKAFLADHQAVKEAKRRLAEMAAQHPIAQADPIVPGGTR